MGTTLYYYKYELGKIIRKKWKLLDSEWELCKKYFNNKCAYCGKETEKLFRDHFENKSMGTINNLIPSCISCNSSKGKKNFYNWFTVNNPIYNDERFDKIIQWINIDSKIL
jgi:hypothetical protein